MTILSEATINASLDAETALLNGGTVNIYSGTAPASLGTAVPAAQNLTVSNLPATAFRPATAGIAEANIIPETTVIRSGTASFYRIFSSTGVPHRQGILGEELTIDNPVFIEGGIVRINNLLVRKP